MTQIAIGNRFCQAGAEAGALALQPYTWRHVFAFLRCAVVFVVIDEHRRGIVRRTLVGIVDESVSGELMASWGRV